MSTGVNNSHLACFSCTVFSHLFFSYFAKDRKDSEISNKKQVKKLVKIRIGQTLNNLHQQTTKNKVILRYTSTSDTWSKFDR